MLKCPQGVAGSPRLVSVNCSESVPKPALDRRRFKRTLVRKQKSNAGRKVLESAENEDALE